ncbi:glycosyltransferase [Paenibacillus vietnamensis]|uniref:glycosyltransferase n=1 Tax=Paenibacillus vietnamensis TaxID=2590547 RepID=UPI001CD05B4B|nr:glycosyltransferase [Paenibacillus vietnamensis]
MKDGRKLKIAIVHDYLNQAGGAERVVGVLHRMFPDAPIYTTIVDRGKLLPELRDAVIHTTFMQRIPGILKRFKMFFWLYPMAVRTMDVRGYDLILSSSSAYAKGVRKGRGSAHLCYCHTPMRFAWDFESYMEGVSIPKWAKAGAKLLTYPLRLWDRGNTRSVDILVANSTVVQSRIKKLYGVSAPIIFPPVDVGRFEVADAAPDDNFLIVSRLVSYKRIDLAVEACTRLGRKLIVIGEGPDRKRLESLAGPSVSFLGRRSDEEVTAHMKRCKAFLFPGIEDFGITPLEANACGRPVIAYGEGGALDTVVPNVTGMFFLKQSPEALMQTIQSFEQRQWDSRLIRKHAESFREDVFVRQLRESISHLTGREMRDQASFIKMEVGV